MNRQRVSRMTMWTVSLATVTGVLAIGTTHEAAVIGLAGGVGSLLGACVTRGKRGLELFLLVVNAIPSALVTGSALAVMVFGAPWPWVLAALFGLMATQYLFGILERWALAG